jgi:hypothetical protein
MGRDAAGQRNLGVDLDANKTSSRGLDELL